MVRKNYAGTQIHAMQWNLQNKGTCTSPARLSFVLKVPLCYLHQSIIYSIPCDQIVQSLLNNSVKPLKSLYENEAWVNFVMIGIHAGELIENSKVLPKI